MSVPLPVLARPLVPARVALTVPLSKAKLEPFLVSVPFESVPAVKLLTLLVILVPPRSSVPPERVIVLLPKVPLPERVSVPALMAVLPL